MTNLDMIFTPSPIWRPYLHDRLTITELGDTGSIPVVRLIGIVHSEFRSGPNLMVLSNATAELLGRSGYFGIHSLRYLGFREVGGERAPAGKPCAYGCGRLAGPGDIFCAPCRSSLDRGGF